METLVKYKTAQLAKEKGYNEPSRRDCHYVVYDQDGELKGVSSAIGSVIHAPNQNELATWLRRVHKYHVFCRPSKDLTVPSWRAVIYQLERENPNIRFTQTLKPMEDYDKSFEKGLIYALNQVKI